jgi:dTDP-4-dehydrorhamnose reductase
MKIWVLGSGGMLGSHFMRTLSKLGYTHLTTSSKEVDIVHCNQIEAFLKTHRPTHIINCTGYTQVDNAESEPELAFQVNAQGPKNLGEAARRYQAKVIHFSTDYVFDGQSRTPYKEDDPCSPLGVYGKSKWEGEQHLLSSLEDACIIRTSWLYGFPGKNFVETMLRLMKEKETVKVVDDQRGRPTYCQDLAEASLKLLDARGIFHIANSQQTTWFGFANEIANLGKDMGLPLIVKNILPITTEEFPTPAKRPLYSVLDTRKVEALNIQPRPWQEALADYLQKSQYTLEAHAGKKH